MSENPDHVYGWVWQLGSIPGAIPPFCVEINLMDGTSYYLHSILQREETNNSLIMRVWDFRSFTPEDIEELKEKLYSVESRIDLDNPREIHPKLDWGDVRLHLQNIKYTIEWNDRLLPQEERKIFMGLIPENNSS